MNHAEGAPPQAPGQLIYGEDHSATRWPMVVSCAVGWAALIGLGIAMNLPHLSGLGILAGVAGIWVLIMTFALYGSLPVGIRIDSAGIEIGGLRGRDRRRRHGTWPPRRLSVGSSSRAVFSCPWEGVRCLYLITDKAELKRVYRDERLAVKPYQGTRAPLGYLRVLFTKSALVITNNPHLTSSEPAEFRTNWAAFGRMRGMQSPTWLVPTRNPAALRAALGECPWAPPVQDHLPPQAVFVFRA